MSIYKCKLLANYSSYVHHVKKKNSLDEKKVTLKKSQSDVCSFLFFQMTTYRSFENHLQVFKRFDIFLDPLIDATWHSVQKETNIYIYIYITHFKT